MKYFIAVFLLSALTIFLLTIFSPLIKNQLTVVSPLPDYLTIHKNKTVSSLDLWLPFFENPGSITRMPQISAKSALTYDITQDKVIYEKNARTKLPMASITKIMTAVIALESKKDKNYIARAEDLVGENSMGIEEGEIFTRRELLYGLLLPSGNDAAEVLASNFEGGRTAFLKAMNSKAQAIGLTNTRFSNPSGLQGDGRQYSTAADLLTLARYALETHPEFLQIVSTYYKELPENSLHKKYHLYNETNLLTTYPGVKGIKTGYTPEAGYCLVTYLDYNGAKLIGIILNSENRRSEMKQLLDYSLTQLSIPPPEFKG